MMRGGRGGGRDGLPGSVCGLEWFRGKEALRGVDDTDDTGWTLGSPRGAHIRDRYSIPHPAWKSDHISHPAGKHIVYGSPSIHDKLSPSAGADVVLIVWLARGRKAPPRSAALRTRSGSSMLETRGEGLPGLHGQGLGWGR